MVGLRGGGRLGPVALGRGGGNGSAESTQSYIISFGDL